MARIVEEPNDDATRLVYADWLEEQGDPLAELIRAQCAGREPGPEVLAALESRIAPVASKLREPRFVRGMFGWLAMKGSEYAKQQAALAPLVTRFGVRQTRLDGGAVKIPQCETLAWTSELWWYDCGLDDKKLEAFAASPHLARLSVLVLEKIRCTNAGLRVLARSPHLAHVRRLGLLAPVHGGSLGPGGEIGGGVDTQGMIELVDQMPITHLDLSGGIGFSMLDLAKLADAPAVAKLEQLAISGSSWEGIARSRHLTGLRALRISLFGRVRDDDFLALVDSATFADLRTFSFDGPPPSDAVIARLQQRFGAGYHHRRFPGQ